MGIPRTFKLKGWVGIFLTAAVFFYLISRTTLQSSQSISNASLQQQNSLAKPIGNAFNRLTPGHQQLLNSALAHIRLGYVANKTPHYSTPPLLVLFSFHQQNNAAHRTLDERFVDITNAYFFSMMQPGSAFAYDMTWPVKFEWFFQSSPGYMSMSSDQANYYKERAQPHEIQYQVSPFSNNDLHNKYFFDDYRNRGIKIISTTNWPKNAAWMALRENPSMKSTRDKYRLNHLPQKSDWFWIASRLLFSRPTGDWFSTQLEAYRDIMGGKLEYSDSLSPYDPQSYKVTLEFSAKQWLRIGLRVSNEEEINCLVSHVANVCRRSLLSTTTAGSCHVFISAPTRNLLKTARTAMTKHRIAVHAVAEGFGFADLDSDTGENTLDHSIFDSDENRLKRDYARTFMDWIILSRMDYLVGQDNDGFLKTAAWAAQVQTDVNVRNDTTNHCRMMPMSDW